MKIAVPTRQGFVDDYLACCECYLIYTVDDDLQVVSREPYYPIPGGCCADSPVARLRQSGVSVILAGNVESSLYSRMTGFGLEVHRNLHGDADRVVRDFLGSLDSGAWHLDKNSLQEDHLNN